MNQSTVQVIEIETAAEAGLFRVQEQTGPPPAHPMHGGPIGGERSPRYANVRMNALTHGILSREAVLAHEDRAEFDRLLKGLLDEHQPKGTTEMHLIEQLASIMWRQRRVLMAEGAAINRSLRSAVGSADSVVRAAAPFEGPMSMDASELRDLLTMTPDQAAEDLREAIEDVEATNAALKHLRRPSETAYRKALKALTAEARDYWLERVSDGRNSATADELRKYLIEEHYPVSLDYERRARLHESIKNQTLGEGLGSDRLEKMARYETHLDRKFERTLAMLLKMKEVRLPPN